MELRGLKIFQSSLSLVILISISSAFCLECKGIKSFNDFDSALSINASMLEDLKSFFNRTELEATMEDDGYKLVWDTGIDSYKLISNTSHPFQRQFAKIQLGCILERIEQFWPGHKINLPKPLDEIWSWDTRTRDGFFIVQRTTDGRSFENKTYQYATKEVFIRMHLTSEDLRPLEEPTLEALLKSESFFERTYLMALYSPTDRIVSWSGKDGYSTTVVRKQSHRLLKNFTATVLREMLEQLDTCGTIRHQLAEIFRNFWDLSSNGGSFFLFRQFQNETWDLRGSSNIYDL